MSMNKFMHPRNIYRTPPSFKELAINYPEFRKFAKQDVSGKIEIDFKNQEALRALTYCLLKRDFELDVEIPLDRLIPTLPLRLNYLLWIEDLVQGIWKVKNEIFHGVDIGTGPSCIYPLLASKTKGWRMVATEVNQESFENAKKNVLVNNLSHLITVKQTQEGVILRDILDEIETFHFSMCNPPFFSNEEELDSSSKSRSNQRPPPHNVMTGSTEELVVEGGEVAFVQQMMRESQELSDKIRIFTTMVGHKCHVAPLKEELKKLGIENFAETTFCQGHTTRWGLAWTFDPAVKRLQALTQNLKRKKEWPPMQYTVPIPKNLKNYNVTHITETLKTLFSELEIEYKQIKKTTQFSIMEISARKNTWSHQRRKRRKERAQIGHSQDKTDVSTEVVAGGKRTLEEEKSVDNKKIKLDPSEECGSSKDTESTGINQQDNYFMKALVSVKRIAVEVVITISPLDGPQCREAVHQILQYLRNNVKLLC